MFSVVVPFLSFEFTTENKIANAVPNYVLPTVFIGNTEERPQTTIFTFENILWIIYGFGLVVFLLRFVRNLISLMYKIRESEKIKKDGFILVLIQNELLPHSFLNYVFVSRNQYKNNQIDKELFVHEKAHVTQKHSLDILFIEVFQIVFWFNPIIYLYKKAIKLNHEFLADQKVNETFREVIHYQNLLLQKATGNSLVPIASNLNYSITKNRLIMMTKNISKFELISKISLSLVLFLAVFFYFSVKMIAQEKNKESEKVIKPNEKKLYAVPVNSLSDEEEKIEKDSYNKADSSVISFEQATKHQQDSIYTAVEVMPEYPGGMNEFRKYISENYKTPEIDKPLKGKVWIQFVVEKDGSLSNMKVVRDLGYGTGEEAVRVLKNAKKWKSGAQNGKPVRVHYTLPIDINIKKSEPDTEKK